MTAQGNSSAQAAAGSSAAPLPRAVTSSLSFNADDDNSSDAMDASSMTRRDALTRGDHGGSTYSLPSPPGSPVPRSGSPGLSLVGLSSIAGRMKNVGRATAEGKAERDRGQIRAVMMRTKRTHADVSFMLRVLSGNTFFDSLELDIRRSVCQICRYERVQEGSCVFMQGDPGDKFYVILTGRVSIHQRMTNVEAAEDRILAVKTGPAPTPLRGRRQTVSLRGPAAISINTTTNTASNNTSSSSKSAQPPLSARLKVMSKDSTDSLLDTLSAGYPEMVLDPEGHSVSLAGTLFLNELGEGDSFGELAMATDSMRYATVVARQPTELLVVEKVHYDSILRKAHADQINELREFTQSVPPLRHLSSEGRAFVNISTFLKKVSFPNRSVIVREGEPVENITFIMTGKCVLSRAVTLSRTWIKGSLPHVSYESHSVDLATLLTREYFGDMALLLRNLGGKQPFSVIADGPVVCLTMSEAEFNRSIKGRSRQKFADMAETRYNHLMARLDSVCDSLRSSGIASLRPSAFDTVRHKSDTVVARENALSQLAESADARGGADGGSGAGLGGGAGGSAGLLLSGAQAGSLSTSGLAAAGGGRRQAITQSASVASGFTTAGGAFGRRAKSSLQAGHLPTLASRFSKMVRGAQSSADATEAVIVRPKTAGPDVAAAPPQQQPARMTTAAAAAAAAAAAHLQASSDSNLHFEEDLERLFPKTEPKRAKLIVDMAFGAVQRPESMSFAGRKLEGKHERAGFGLKFVIGSNIDETGASRKDPPPPRPRTAVVFGKTTPQGPDSPRVKFVNTLNHEHRRRITDDHDHTVASERADKLRQLEREERLKRSWKKTVKMADKVGTIAPFDIKAFLPDSITNFLYFQTPSAVPSAGVSQRDMKSLMLHGENATLAREQY